MSKVKGFCGLCGKLFFASKSRKKKFCGHKCANLFNNKEKSKKTKKIEFNCLNCKQIVKVSKSAFDYGRKRKFCSPSCRDLHKKRKDLKCLFCNKIFKPKRKEQIFCGNSCSQFFKNKEKGKGNGKWMENGYVVFYNKGKNIKEHIYIMQKTIGRNLKKNEIVHHINEIKTDNRIENLELMTKSEHSSLHRKKEITKGKLLFGRSKQNEAQAG